VERVEGAVAWEIGPEIRMYTLPDGVRLFSRPGHLLRRCADGRLIAWIADEQTFQIIDVWTGALVGAAPRDPGFVIGADSACAVLYTQRLDGALVENRFAGEPLGARVIAAADGYVYDARPSPPRGGVGPGIWLALSSGAIARIEEQRGAVRLLGYATPRASAIAEGPSPGAVVYADASGVVVLDASGKAERVLEAGGESPWEDLSISPDGSSMLLASVERIAALDLKRRELSGSIPTDARSRLSPWDEAGPVLAWSPDRAGGADGQVIPRGVPLARQLAAALSNLAIDKGKLVIRR